METTTEREVIRCMHCKLNQFVVSSRKCRRCHQLVEPPLVVPEVKPLNPLASVNDVNNPKDFINIPAALRLLRNAFGFSQRDLGSRIGVARTYISKMESRFSTPGVETIGRISNAFEITPYAFISLAEALAR